MCKETTACLRVRTHSGATAVKARALGRPTMGSIGVPGHSVLPGFTVGWMSAVCSSKPGIHSFIQQTFIGPTFAFSYVGFSLGSSVWPLPSHSALPGAPSLWETHCLGGGPLRGLTCKPGYQDPPMAMPGSWLFMALSGAEVTHQGPHLLLVPVTPFCCLPKPSQGL